MISSDVHNCKIHNVICSDGLPACQHGFDTITSISKRLGKPYPAIYRQITRHETVTLKRLCEVKVQGEPRKPEPTPLKLTNQLLRGVFGIKKCTFDAALRRGLTKRQALQIDESLDARTVKGKRSDNEVKLKKATLKAEMFAASSDVVTLNDICTELGFTEAEIEDHLKNGRLIEQALGFEPLSGIRHEEAERLMFPKPLNFGLVVWDLWYRNLDQYANEWGLDLSRVQRLKKQGVPLEDVPFFPDKANPGLYSLERFKRDPELANKPATLYLASFMLDGRPMIKVGVTCSSVEKRLYPIKGPKTVLAEYEGRLVDCFCAEQLALELMRDMWAFPRAKGIAIEGKTETFCNRNPDTARESQELIGVAVEYFSLRGGSVQKNLPG